MLNRLVEVCYDRSMPSPNTVKAYDAPAYYHVYNRGAGRQNIFIDPYDRRKFLSILKRHLSKRSRRGSYTLYDVELVAYCLMSNHFHLLIYIPEEPREITGLMRSVGTAYSMYFNKRHDLSGHLFQGIYKASLISNDSYLAHISRYIHLNPRGYRTYEWSSLREYLGERHTDWVHPERVLGTSPEKYLEFLESYEDRKQLLDEMKHQLHL